MHISDAIEQALQADGWTNTYKRRTDGFGDDAIWQKRTIAPASHIGSYGGTRITMLTISANGRYLARVDGWGKVERDIDLRNYTDATAAIAAIVIGE